MHMHIHAYAYAYAYIYIYVYIYMQCIYVYYVILVQQHKRGDPVVKSEYERTESKLIFRRTVRDASEVNINIVYEILE